MVRLLLSYLFILLSLGALSQSAIVFGKVLDENHKPLFPSAHIYSVSDNSGVVTNTNGSYLIKIPANKDVVLRFSYVEYLSIEKTVNLKPDQQFELNIIFSQRKSLDTFTVVDVVDPKYGGVIKFEPKQIEGIPSTSGDKVIDFIKKAGVGISSNNEMSSQYSVRGGNFDENLVYVNGIEVYRPLLVRSGQQEGLSFINSDMVKSIKFSAGGFDAIYGDKMSSVLDIEYKSPTRTAGSASFSLLGGSVSLEGIAKKMPFRYLTGFRYKSNQYILKAMETKGDFRPSFLDWQTYLAYDISEKFTIDFLGNYAVNKYLFIPETRETNFGNIFEALRFKVYFDGQELDRFRSTMGAISGNYRDHRYSLKFSASVYDTKEVENYDIMGQYWLQVLENDLGKDDFGEVAFTKGIGTFINHARNYIMGNILSLSHKGSFKEKSYWGLEYRRDNFKDRISEWQLMDSAGFVLPHIIDNIGNLDSNYTPSNQLLLTNVIKSKNEKVISQRISAYYQRKWNFSLNRGKLLINSGLRANYWDFNKEFLLSPRLSFSFKPSGIKKLEFRLATGIYSQPALYREMRDYNGALNNNTKAQKSFQVVGGSEFSFVSWDRPFKLTSEVYYKRLWDMIPYEVNDVKIRYFANQTSKGYATGLDLKLFGEIVKDAESWVGISIMSTKEDIIGDYHYKYKNAAGEIIDYGTKDKIITDSVITYPGYIPRPTDQRFNFNMYFQDYIPGYPTYKVHLNFVYASGLPFGQPRARYQQVNRLPAYRRVDIGFSKQLIGENTQFKSKSPFRHIKSMWVSIEVFNLLQISNTISYLWITDVTGSIYGIPNYLTPRQLNVSFIAKF